MPHEGTPAEAHISAAWRKKIVHASMRVGGAIVMGSDVPAEC
jgi:PhnB protein